jgi:PAS domain S-box-containing protein
MESLLHTEFDKEMDDFFNLINSFYINALQNKNRNEIISSGLKILSDNNFISSASLFLYDPVNFDFQFSASTLQDSIEIIEIYNKCVEDGSIAQVLNSSEPLEINLINSGENKTFFIILLQTNSGIIGLIILSLFNTLGNIEFVKRLCVVHCRNFANILQNIDLKNELDTLKETIENKVAIRTKDIVQSTRELKLILDTVQACIIIVNKTSDVIEDVNLLAAKTIGKEKANIIGTKSNDYFLFSNIKVSAGEVRTDEGALLQKANGEIIAVIRTVAEIVMGNDSYYLENFIDISERRLMEEAILKSQDELEKRVEARTAELNKTNLDLRNQITERIKAEEEKLKLYSAVNQSPISIIITDLKGNIEYVNPKFTKVTGYKYGEVVGLNPRILKSGDLSADAYKNLWKSITHDKEWHGEFRNKKKNGDTYWVFSSISPVKNAKGEVTNYIAVQEDITARKKIAQELLTAKDKAEESNRLKTALLANMSHEFRTPLISILGFSEYLISEIKETDLLEMLNDIHSSGQRLLHTLDGVLHLSQLETLKSSLKLVKTNITASLKISRLNFLKAASAKQLELNLEINSGDIYAAVDLDLFNKAVNGLIENAIKFTSKGSVTIISEIVKQDDANWVIIQIQDTGIGIDDNDQKTIFEAFRQVSEGHIRDYEGCGLGLTLSQKYIELMGGFISLQSEKSKGSAFSIWLPAM